MMVEMELVEGDEGGHGMGTDDLENQLRMLNGGIDHVGHELDALEQELEEEMHQDFNQPMPPNFAYRIRAADGSGQGFLEPLPQELQALLSIPVLDRKFQLHHLSYCSAHSVQGMHVNDLMLHKAHASFPPWDERCSELLQSAHYSQVSCQQPTGRGNCLV